MLCLHHSCLSVKLQRYFIYLSLRLLGFARLDVDDNVTYVLFSDILFSKFRIGWKMTVDAIPLESSTKPNLQTFLVVVEKEVSTLVHQITPFLDSCSLQSNSKQVEHMILLHL